MTARQISDSLLAGKTPTATRKQEEALQAAIFAALRVRDGKTVVGEGSPARWRLKEIADQSQRDLPHFAALEHVRLSLKR